jgi:hypothetical protein
MNDMENGNLVEVGLGSGHGIILTFPEIVLYIPTIENGKQEFFD